MRNKLWTLALLAMTSVVAFGQVAVIGSTVDAKTGFKNNGAAPNAHYLCGNGTVYVDSATPCGGLFYQTVDENGTAQTQRPALNFSAFFNLTDSASPARTTVDAAQVGANATCTNPSSVTVDAYGRTTACSSGTKLTQFAHLGTTSCNFASPGTGNMCTDTMTLPAPFADASYGAVCWGMNPTSGGSDSVIQLALSSITDSQHFVIQSQALSTGSNLHYADIYCIASHN